MKFTFIYVILAACLLTACQKEVDHETVYEPYSGSPTTTHGTIDSGGGNGFCDGNQQDCKPLEAYRVDPDQLKKDNPDLAQVLTSLEKAYLPLAGDFLHIMRDRGWYVVPASLDQISATQLGVNFSTDQLALQGRRELWFAQKLVDPMAEPDRAQLLVHELVMGTRILEFTDSEDQCIATATRDLLPEAAEHKYDDKRSKCISTYGAAALLPQADFTLNDKDYANIRDLTALLFKSKDQMDGKAIEDWISAHQFRVYR